MSAERNLKTIVTLCETPYWDANRRWRILKLALEALADLKDYPQERSGLGDEGQVLDD